MQANPEKFQAIAVGKKSFDKSPIFQIGTANISCDEVVKLLGVDIDFMLNFDCHIKNICSGGRPFKILNVSSAIVLILLICCVGIFCFNQ
jgi:hypothetical protein